jgi:flagellin
MALASGFKVNTNTSALQTYRSYSKSQAGLEQNIERLSSGLRINRAADDTAGQAISQRMRNQSSGMRQAVRNSQQATNYLQTAEGGLNQIHGILSRMRELAVQAASDNLTNNDRFSIELEYSQLKNEVSRIGDSTTYNDMKLINGDRAKDVTTSMMTEQIASFSVNSNVTTNDTFDFIEVDSGAITLRNTSTTPAQTQTLYQPDGGFSQGDILNFDKLGITIELGSQFEGIDDQNEVTNADGVVDPPPPTVTDKFTVTQGDFVTMQIGAYNDAKHAGDDASDANDKGVTENRITLNLSDATSRGLGIQDSGVDALADAQRAVNALDSAIEKVNDERSNIGSLQNRFEFAVSNLQSGIQNTDASRSSIQDADFAMEAAGLAKNQILTQSGTAMLAQANQISQNVLSLLK